MIMKSKIKISPLARSGRRKSGKAAPVSVFKMVDRFGMTRNYQLILLASNTVDVNAQPAATA